MNIDIDDYNLIRTRDRLAQAKQLLEAMPSQLPPIRWRAIKLINTMIEEIDSDIGPRIHDDERDLVFISLQGEMKADAD